VCEAHHRIYSSGRSNDRKVLVGAIEFYKKIATKKGLYFDGKFTAHHFFNLNEGHEALKLLTFKIFKSAIFLFGFGMYDVPHED
jgi:hypothetical protein